MCAAARVTVPARPAGVAVRASVGAVVACLAVAGCGIGRPGGGESWRAMEPPRVAADTSGNEFSAVLATGAGHAWAVGDSTYPGKGREGDTTGLAARWDGHRWVPVAPPATRRDSEFDAVSGTSEHDVWVGGRDGDNAVLEHWDGRGWRRYAQAGTAESPGSVEAVLTAGAADAWAIGSAADKGFLLHWDGHGWSRAASPLTDDPRVRATALAGSSARDIWAVGLRYADATQDGSTAVPMLAHWDGAAWTVAATPPVAAGSALSSVASDGPGSVWAVGSAGPEGRQDHGLPLAEHWDGKSWSLLPAPPTTGALGAVVGDGHGGAWVGQGSDPSRTRLLHWDGHHWSGGKPPTPDGYTAPGVRDLARAPGTTTLWAVGGTDNRDGGRPGAPLIATLPGSS